ncbi:hypothetical protein [Streptomyces sp. NPDC056227]|uniref:hypothetical protein n=1 Tax=Streptomyces sp. NPDC056227 TaxID=3345753 RepID=UPI0035D9C4C3
MSGLLRPGNAGANTVAVLDQALAQIPDAHRHSTDILMRTDSAGSAKALLTHLRACVTTAFTCVSRSDTR